MVNLVLPVQVGAVPVAPVRLTSSSPGTSFADCVPAGSVVTPRPLARRPRVARKTLRRRPRPALAHRKPVARKPVAVAQKKAPVKVAAVAKKTVAKRPVAPRKTVLAKRRPARKAPIQLASAAPIRKLTYVSPLCPSRVASIDTFISNLPEIDAIDAPTVAAIAPEDIIINIPDFADLVTPPGPPVPGGGSPPFFPGLPGFPGGGGGGGGNPDNPGENPDEPGNPGEEPPPPPPLPVPEPASWATMLVGFLMIGMVIRRRRPEPSRPLA
jgi:hypothetical protein